jgi:replicative DNA helicase
MGQDTVDEVGGLGYVAGLSGAVTTDASLYWHCERIIEAAERRKTLYALMDAAASCYDLSNDGYLEGVNSLLFSPSEGKPNAKTPKEAWQSAFESILEQLENPESTLGVSTGFYGLDEALGGLRPGALYS